MNAHPVAGTVRPRIALIHAVKVAIDPVQDAFRQIWPEAECVNLLDDSLSIDRTRDEGMTKSMHGRIRALADYAVSIKSDGILYTCSAFGEAIEAVAQSLDIPVLKPNEAMFEVALKAGQRIGMLATFQPSVVSMEEEFRLLAQQRGSKARIETFCVAGAMAALQAGDAQSHNHLLAEAAPRFQSHDAVLLAHFSTSRAASSVEAALGRPVHTSPGSAVAKLKALITT